MTQPIEVEELFERTLEFPDDDARERYNALVGLEDAKARLCKEALIRLHPGRLSDWVATHHNGSLTAAGPSRPAPTSFHFCRGRGNREDRACGDIRLGHCRILGAARFLLSPKPGNSRNRDGWTDHDAGAVRVFAHISDQARQARRGDHSTTGFVLVVDEADSLAQSREQTPDDTTRTALASTHSCEGSTTSPLKDFRLWSSCALTGWRSDPAIRRGPPDVSSSGPTMTNDAPCSANCLLTSMEPRRTSTSS